MKEDLLWEKYKHEVEIHRGYLDLAIKLNAFNYAISGAIISFYFLHIKEEPLLKYSLLLPFIMSAGLSLFFFTSALSSTYSQNEIKSLAEALNFKGFSVVASVLGFLLLMFAITLVIVSAGIVVLFFKSSIIVI